MMINWEFTSIAIVAGIWLSSMIGMLALILILILGGTK